MRTIIKLAIVVAAALVLFSVGYFCGQAARLSPASVAPHHVPHELLLAPSQGSDTPHDYFLKSAELDELKELVAAAAGWHSVDTLTVATLSERQENLHELADFVSEVLDEATLSLTDDHYAPARDALDVVRQAFQAATDRLDALLFAAAGRVEAPAPQNSSAEPVNQPLSQIPRADLVVTVKQRPFGILFRSGSMQVEMVPPDHQAARLGVRPGCEMTEIAGQPAFPGTWINQFQEAELPFDVRLNCPQKVDTGSVGSPSTSNPKNFEVLVFEKPFGMDVQGDVFPQVVEVLPGFPAEEAGVRPGFNLTKVNNKKVDVETWFEAFDQATVPFLVTFDTTGTKSNSSISSMPKPSTLPRLDDKDFLDFRCDVIKVPFGMQVREVPNSWPVVRKVVPSGIAVTAGVRVGDVLVEVAGREVDSSTWFSAFEQAAAPFGLKFRRRRS
eukprot:TRINITY_DN68703_c0_g1_i1.p1 TRINITY_DN68703_c0_g1~~TRINITY_DN68703_c0_g1_i1.p1  ORF type:complete len:443 (-),score=68.03 TRINITY_DN68703_c0_g1_i1:111-1439(-)